MSYESIIKNLISDDKNSLKNDFLKLEMESLPNMIYTRISGFVSDIFRNSNDHEKNEVINALIELHDLNYIRNIAILNEVITLNNLALENNHNFVWLKGVKDLKKTPEKLFIKKMADVDILVENFNEFRDLMLSNGFNHGGYTYDGELIEKTLSEAKELEKNHYELYPLYKKIPLKIENQMTSFKYKKWLNKFRIFTDNSNDYFTDLAIDTHKELTFGLLPNWILENNKTFPMMSNEDEVWYLIHKCFYEVIQGESRDIQLLIFTVNKIREYNMNFEKITQSMRNSDFINEEAINTMLDITTGNISEEVLKHLNNKVINYDGR